MLYPNIPDTTSVEEWVSCGKTLASRINRQQRSLNEHTIASETYNRRAKEMRLEAKAIPKHNRLALDGASILDAAEVVARNMLQKCEIRRAVNHNTRHAAQSERSMKETSKLLAELQSQMAMDKTMHTESIESFNERLKQLPVELELTSIVKKSNRKYYFYFTIGEHVLRPVKSSLGSRCMDHFDQDHDFDLEFYKRGVDRPPMAFIMSVSLTSSNRVQDVDLHMTMYDPINQHPDVGLGEDGSRVMERMMDEYPSECHLTPSRHNCEVYPHPHLRGYYDSDRGNRGFDAQACVGSFSGPLCKAVESNNPVMIGMLLMQYFQSCDLNDSYGKQALWMFNSCDLRSEGSATQEEAVTKANDNPVWIPQFIVVDNSIQFLNKPDGFDYSYTVTLTLTSLNRIQLDTHTTAEPSQVFAEDLAIRVVEVCTSAGECAQVTLRR